MASKILGGPRTWLGERDDEGFVEYKVVHLVECDRLDGPVVIMSTAGLPVPGAAWNFGGAEVNTYAYCKWDMKTSYVGAKGGCRHYEVEQTFTTKPTKARCIEAQVTNPLLEPQKVRGGIHKITEEATVDMYGTPITSSSFEQLRGPSNEWDVYDSGWTIAQNVANLQLDLCASMANTVNAYSIWGCAPRTVRLSAFEWERKFYGTCSVYYTRQFEFQHRARGWDRAILDEGTKVLNGHWHPGSGNWVIDPVGQVRPPAGLELVVIDEPGTGNIPPGSVASYVVTAVTSEGETTPSAPASNNVAGSTQRRAYLSWRAVAGADTYAVYRSEDGGPYRVVSTVAGTSWTDNSPWPASGDPPPTVNSTRVEPDYLNPQHYRRAVDRQGNPMRLVLNGAGLPAGVGIGSGSGFEGTTGPGYLFVQYYRPANYLLLGVPTTF